MDNFSRGVMTEKSDSLDKNQELTTEREKRTEHHHLPAIVIEAVYPEIDGGLFAAKCIVEESFSVRAEVFKDGHDVLSANILYKKKGQRRWEESPMNFLGNDQWEGVFTPKVNTRYIYTIEAWVDPVATWIQKTGRKCAANQSVESDVLEGLELLNDVRRKAKHRDQKTLDGFIKILEESGGVTQEVWNILQDNSFLEITARVPIKLHKTHYSKNLELTVDRRRAQFAAWYEMFPRSQGRMPGKSGTFKDCLPEKF